MQQEITRGDYLKDLITIYVENNLQKDLDELYSEFIFQCGSIQKVLEPAQIIKISFDEKESSKLTNYNVCYLAGITVDGHKETFNGSISFDTRGEVVMYEPNASGSNSEGATYLNNCDCQGIKGVFGNCCQPAIKAYFSINYVPTKLSELTNDTDFVDSVDVAESISEHNSNEEAHPYIQSVITSATESLEVSIANEAGLREQADNTLQANVDTETSLRVAATEALQGSINAETTAREQAVSLAISTTEAYADNSVSVHNSSTSAHTYIQGLISAEVTNRENADNNLQTQIDGLAAASDVTDIVGTYQDLQNYDTQHLNDNDIIKVLSDSTHNGAPSYYRFDKDTDTFSYIGSEAETYTKAEANSIFVTQTTEVNGHALSSDINLTASDVGALADSYATVISANTSAIASNTSVIAQHTTAIATNTSDITGLKNLSNLTTTGEARLHALKSYSDNGELLTDAEGLADVKNYAHSTFDASKFTKVGSPIVTEDGIASGFSSGNYVTFNFPDYSKPYKVSYSFTTSSTMHEQYIFRTNGYRLWMILNAQNKFYIACGTSDYGTNLFNFITADSLLANTEYNVVFEFTGTQYKAYLNGNLLKTTDNSTAVNASSNVIYLGQYVNTSSCFEGSIDLKKLYVESDGIPVFSGNQTGIDTIKEDNYEVVGNPTITNDGVASNFSSSNYITASTIDLSKGTWDIYAKLTTGSDVASSHPTFVITNAEGTINNVAFGIYQNKVIFSIGNSTNSAWQFVNEPSNTTLSVNTTYWLKFSYNGNKYSISFSNDNGKTYIQDKDFTGYSTVGFTAGSYILIGRNRNPQAADYFNGSFDLNSFKVYVNGSLVYQPCLKIPYTLSKTGSKVVNSVYRPRVNDMAGQLGWADYYTLSDIDFTLPQVEVYGLAEKFRASNIENKQDIKAINDYKALNTGDISENELVLEQLKERVHSTFDSSKFTKVGSPVIVDGVMSDCGYNDYTKISNSVFTNISNKKWKLKWSGKLPQYGNYPLVIGNNYQSTNSFINVGRFNTTNNFYVELVVNDNGTPTLTAIKYLILNYNDEPNYDGYVEFTGTKYIMGIRIEGQSAYTTVEIDNSNPIMPQSNDLALGYNMRTGSIDLKQISLEVDGVPIFSGNKTGIDTIKPDDYTPEGSIASNITDDGIVVCTTTGSTDYIDKSISIPQGSKLRIEARLRTPKGINASGATGASWLRCYLSNTMKIQTYMSYWGFTFSMSSVPTGNVLERSIASDTWYKILIEYDGTDSYTFNVKKESDTTWTSVTKTGVTPTAFDEIRINADLNNTTGGYTIDLNALKIYVDGDLVYQPCLKIPYTESKTGSKIVNSIYRDRVDDMANQFGYAPYYTLSDTDFSIPKGDLYGLINRQSFVPSDKYKNLTLGANGSAYTAPADGWFAIVKGSTAANQYVTMINTTSNISSAVKSPEASTIRLFLPVKKNDVVTVGYTANGTTAAFNFIYSVGSESEAN